MDDSSAVRLLKEVWIKLFNTIFNCSKINILLIINKINILINF